MNIPKVEAFYREGNLPAGIKLDAGCTVRDPHLFFTSHLDICKGNTDPRIKKIFYNRLVKYIRIVIGTITEDSKLVKSVVTQLAPQPTPEIQPVHEIKEPVKQPKQDLELDALESIVSEGSSLKPNSAFDSTPNTKHHEPRKETIQPNQSFDQEIDPFNVPEKHVRIDKDNLPKQQSLF
jgi:hypothetical protein